MRFFAFFRHADAITNSHNDNFLSEPTEVCKALNSSVDIAKFFIKYQLLASNFKIKSTTNNYVSRRLIYAFYPTLTRKMLQLHLTFVKKIV